MNSTFHPHRPCPRYERYRLANEAYDNFFPVWQKAREDYRCVVIHDAEFLALKEKKAGLLQELNDALAEL
jgi:hypothetical protein